MATRRKKASTRVRAVQRKPSKKTAKPKARGAKKSEAKKPLKKAAVQRGSKTAKKKASRAPKGAKKQAKKRARKPKTRTASVIKQAQSGFMRMRKAALKSGKLVLPKFTKKKGKLRLRGTKGKERTIVVGDFWENVREGWVESRVMKAFLSLFSEFSLSPTLYARFTFTATNVRTALTAGSPKLIRSTRKKVKHWFLSSGLSYSVEGMRYQFQQAWDTINKEVQDATRNNYDATFFFEYVTCVAYLVRN